MLRPPAGAAPPRGVGSRSENGEVRAMIERTDGFKDGREHVPGERRRWRLWQLLLVVLLVATALGLAEGIQQYLGTIAAGAPQLSFWLALASTMPSWYVLGLLLPITFWLARRFPLDGRRWKLSLLVHFPAAVAFSFIHVTASAWVSTWLQLRSIPEIERIAYPTFPETLGSVLGLYFVIDLFFYGMFVGVAHALTYRRRYLERERLAAQLSVKASRLEASLARANLDSLRMQLNPHFLFNTLNAISVLALKGERHSVVRTLTLLSDLLRVSLENDAQVVPLSEEISFLERYVEIEQIRFKDRLTVVMELAPESLVAEVPALVLQPLVENAVRHGISRKSGPGVVTVQSSVSGGRLTLVVQDTGPGFGKAIDSARTGIGLANTRARLEQLYGQEQSLDLEDAPGGGAIVRVTLPCRSCESTGNAVVNSLAEPRYA